MRLQPCNFTFIFFSKALKASCMQAAIDSMTRSLALEWGSYGIRVSGIAPGWIADTTGNDNHYSYDCMPN